MAHSSLKQRLIVSLRQELSGLPSGHPRRLTIEWDLRELNHRGSGPLPRWARSLARVKGLTE